MKEELICPICLDYFADPFILRACSHNLCRACLVSLINDDKIVCPSCRSVTDCPNADVEQCLQFNLTVRNLVESVRQQEEAVSAKVFDKPAVERNPPKRARKTRKAQKRDVKSSSVSTPATTLLFLILLVVVAFFFPWPARSQGSLVKDGESLRLLSETATSLSKVGSMLQSQGKLGEALDHFNRSYHSFVKIHGKNGVHSDIAQSLSKLGSVLFHLGRLSTALKYHHKALALMEEIHAASYGGNESQSFLHLYGELLNVANVLFSQQQWNSAVEYYTRALQMYDKGQLRGKEYLRNLILCHTKIGQTLQHLGDHGQALDHFYKAHSLIVEKGGGTNDNEMALSFLNIASALVSLEQLAEGLDLQNEALVLLQDGLEGSPHVDKARALKAMGLTLERMGRLADAAQRLSQSAAMLESLNSKGIHSRDIAALKNNIGVVYLGLGMVTQAFDSHTHAHSIYSKLNDLEGRARSLKLSGDVYGLREEAAIWYKKSLEITLEMHKKHSQKDRELGELNYLIAKVLMRAGKWAEAVSHLLEAERSFVLEFSGSHETLGSVHLGLGSAYRHMGSNSKSIVALDAGVDLCVPFLSAAAAEHAAVPIANSTRECVGLLVGAVADYDAVATVLLTQEQYSPALHGFTQALSLRTQLLDAKLSGIAESQLVVSHFNVGVAHFSLADKSRASDSFRRALQVWDKLDGNRDDVPLTRIGETLAYLGSIFDSEGQGTLALGYFARALGVFRELGDREMIVSVERAVQLLERKQGLGV